MRAFVPSLAVVTCGAVLFPGVSSAQTPTTFDAPQVQIDHLVEPFRKLIDLDGDPYPDAVGAWPNSNQAQFRATIYRNDGTGKLEEVWSDPSVVPGSPQAGQSGELQVEVADLDGDGDEDFCIALGNDVWDFLVEPGQAVPVEVQTSPSAVFGLGLHDLDGDGAADHVLSHIFDVSINLSGSPGEYTVLHDLYDFPLTLDAGAMVAVRFTDGDGDGDTDVLLMGRQRFQWIWLTANGGLQGTSARQEVGFDFAMGDLGDVDGDGDTDGVFFGMTGEYRVLRQGPIGTWTLEANRVGGPAEYLMDVDGDGDLDGACCGGGGGTPPFDHNLLESNFEIALGDGTGGFAPSIARAGLGSPHLAGVADMDGDGTLDLVAGRVVWFGASESLAALTPATGPVEARLVADVDMDGDPDFGFGLNGAVLNQGDGRFASQAPTISGTPAGVTYVGPGFCGDVDGDGDADLLVEAWNGPSLVGMRRLDNAGGGHLVDVGLASAPGVSFSIGSLAAENALFGDVDGDFDVDLVVRGPNGTNLTQVWKQGAGGVFALDQTITGLRAEAIEDFDQDGFVDLLVMEPQGSLARLQMMVGGPGGFVLDEAVLAGQGWSFNPAYPSKVAVVDLQGTGYKDIAVASFATALIRNRVPVDGVFAFTGTTVNTGAPESDARIFAGDVDGNGFQDLVIGPVSGAPRSVVVARNLTGGWFPSWTTETLVHEPTPLTDLDGDGDVDLAGAVIARGNAVPLSATGVREQYGTANAGTGGAAPTLGATGPFNGGNPAALVMTGGVGSAIGAVAVGFEQAELPNWPVAGVTTLMNPFDPALAVVSIPVGGTPGGAGAGHWTLPYTVETAFAGLTAYHQVFLLDQGAPGFFTATNGLRLTYAP